MRHTRAFTLIELLVTLAVIALLAGFLLPSAARAKASALTAGCRNNLRQLQLGYLMYVHDNNDTLPPNRAQSFGFEMRNVEGSWVLGNARRDVSSSNIEAGVIYRHVGSPQVYRCPGDKSTVLGSAELRTRSYSLNGWLNVSFSGKGSEFDSSLYPWGKFRLSEIGDPGPAQVFAFIDEHEESVEAGAFIMEQPPEVTHDNTTDKWFSLPADRHEQGCVLSFLDGHVDYHRWKFRKRFRQFIAPAVEDLEDQKWLQHHLPRDPVRQVDSE